MARRTGRTSKRRSAPSDGRLPFDPSRMAFRAETPPPPPAPQAPPPQSERLTVTQLSERITSTLRSGLPAQVRVLGEISGVSERTHFYFKLKDEGAAIDCVLFAGGARRGRGPVTPPREGMQVVATGRVDHYARQGRTQLYVDALEPVGAGALEARLRALCEELRALGWFDEARKRPLPVFPRRVAVVTSLNGAALHDVLDTMRRRCPAVDILLVDVRVQSDPPLLAATEIARAVEHLSRHHAALGVQAVVVTRGGGSIEDLWAFNERIVGEAILKCAVPVVAAIGHESDVTIAELVADVRAATPTQAAMRVTPDTVALLEQLDQHSARMRHAAARRLGEARLRLASSARRPIFLRPRALLERPAARVEDLERALARSAADRVRGAQWRLERLQSRLARLRPAAILSERAARLAELERRLARAASVELERRASRLGAAERALIAVGPMAVLQRGFSVTLRANGLVVRSASELAPGDRLLTRLAEGQVASLVEGDPPMDPTRSASRPPPGGPGSPGLFQ